MKLLRITSNDDFRDSAPVIDWAEFSKRLGRLWKAVSPRQLASSEHGLRETSHAWSRHYSVP